MTYETFLIVFLVPALAILITGIVLSARREPPANWWTPGIGLLLALAVSALLYTTPWDSWLIRDSMWSYSRGRVMDSLWGVPAEEFAFMVGQTLITGLWTLLLIRHSDSRTDRVSQLPDRARLVARHFGSRIRLRMVTACCWLAAAAIALVAAAATTHASYLAAILAWFGLPLAIESLTGADVLQKWGWLRAAAVAVPTAYLWIADRAAILQHTWRISMTHTLDLRPAGLPVEEALFFLLVNIVVANAVLLATSPVMQARLHWPRQLPLPRSSTWESSS